MDKKKRSNLILAGLACAAAGVMFFLFIPPSAPAGSAEPQKQEKRKPEKPKQAESIGDKITDAVQGATAAVRLKTGTDDINPNIDVPIKGDLRLKIIDPSTIALAGDYENFLRERFIAEGGPFLKGVDSDAANLPEWSRKVFYNVTVARIILKYRPAIGKAWQNTEGWKLEGGPGLNLKIETEDAKDGFETIFRASSRGDVEHRRGEEPENGPKPAEQPTRLNFQTQPSIARTGYWLSPMGQARFPDVNTGEDKLMRSAHVVHHAFLKLDKPLEEGARYTLVNPFGQSVEFTYNRKDFPSPAIKLNQVGYAPQAARKYAYVGAWLGLLGAKDFPSLTGAPFHVRDEAGDAVLNGTIMPRGRESYYKDEIAFTGESVYELDFSALNKPGRYYIDVPGLGISDTFAVGNDAIGEAAFIHTRGLYHKRCGIAKEAPWTAWPSGQCHMRTYRAHFPPNDRHYKEDPKRTEAGFFDAAGKSVRVEHFKLIDLTKTDELVPTFGGWHDAADYDRRPYHYEVVNDLLSAYLLKPKNFSDGQFNIPESGNGVPDIIDEAAWGMEVWKRAQNPDGSVGGWIEATSHPKDFNPATDTQRYYLSDATMESSMQYAAHASMLALAYREAGQKDAALQWQASAAKAFAFANDASHRHTASYNYPFERTVNGKKALVYEPITYKEAPTPPANFTFKAAFNLYLLTRNSSYLEKCRALAPQMPQAFTEMAWRVNPLSFTEFAKYNGGVQGLEKIYDAYRARVLKLAEERLAWLNGNYPYRIAWYPASHAYVTNMSWGTYHPLVQAKYFMAAHAVTGSQIFRDAAYLSNDWHNGANPSGQTMTSGLGRNYPVRFLDCPSYTDGVAEFVPGITPYRDTFGIARDDVKLAHALDYEARPDRNFTPSPVPLLPVLPESAPFLLETYTKALGKAWPIWRRWANVEAFTVAASEYTVSETIGPAAGLTGWLLEPGWMPNDALKNKQPAKDILDLEGAFALP